MNALEYFAAPGAMTYPGRHPALFECLPSEIGELDPRPLTICTTHIDGRVEHLAHD